MLKKPMLLKLTVPLALIVATTTLPTYAQTYPAKTIRVIVPLAAGGPGDVLARAIGQKLSAQVAQSVVIDNRPGANTNVGNEFVAKAPADGYTLLATASTLTINPSLYPALPYDALRDFAPITLMGPRR